MADGKATVGGDAGESPATNDLDARLRRSEAERVRLHAALYAVACLNSDALGPVIAREALGLPERFEPHIHVLAAARAGCYPRDNTANPDS